MSISLVSFGYMQQKLTQASLKINNNKGKIMWCVMESKNLNRTGLGKSRNAAGTRDLKAAIFLPLFLIPYGFISYNGEYDISEQPERDY